MDNQDDDLIIKLNQIKIKLIAAFSNLKSLNKGFDIQVLGMLWICQ